jgi:hypothetical protein
MVDTHHAHCFAVFIKGRMGASLDEVSRTVTRPDHPEHILVVALTPQCSGEGLTGAGPVFRVHRRGPGLVGAPEVFGLQAVQAVHHIVPDQHVLGDVPVPYPHDAGRCGWAHRPPGHDRFLRSGETRPDGRRPACARQARSGPSRSRSTAGRRPRAAGVGPQGGTAQQAHRAWPVVQLPPPAGGRRWPTGRSPVRVSACATRQCPPVARFPWSRRPVFPEVPGR